MHRFGSLLALAFMFGCGPGLVAEDGETGTDSTSGDGDGDAGDGDGDGDAGDGDGDGDAGDGDGDGDGDAWPPGCEPQMASSTQDTCDEPSFAWIGNGCAAICACEGQDCAETWGSVGECLAAHEPDCGIIGLDTCPFEEVVGATMVSGTTSYGSSQWSHGAFGVVYGESTPVLSVVLAPDLVALGNHLWNAWDPPESSEVLTVWGATTMAGEHEVYVGVAIPLARGVMGTLTITSVVTQGDFVDHQLWATLAVDEAEWVLGGDIAIGGCQRLEQHLP
jgi:hypothetical protein